MDFCQSGMRSGRISHQLPPRLEIKRCVLTLQGNAAISVLRVFCGWIFLAVVRTPQHQPKMVVTPPEVVLLC